MTSKSIAGSSDPPGIVPAAAPPPADPEIAPGRIDGVLDLAAIFANDRPVELEVGTGKGRFLIEQAAARPDVNFLGLEWSAKYLRVARERALRRAIPNLRLFRADARHVVSDLLADGAVRRVHVYCPDPWPKKRHHKRRFFTPALAPHLERVLAPGGWLHVSTDVEEYFIELREVLLRGTRLVEAADPLFPPDAPAGKTSYEAKYLEGGRIIHRASFRRAAGSF